MSNQAAEKLVMYLILRSDLITDLKWPLGAIFTQIAHAATSCIWTFREEPEVQEYMKQMDSMHKVTLKVDNEKSLLEHSIVLTNAKIQHKVWIEDGMAVCLAVKPMPKQRLKPFIGGLPLYK